MAAVTELCFLLFALINNIHAEERIKLMTEWDSYTFNLPKEANSCLISRFVGEEKLVLWNTSDLWSENSTVPEDLKQRLSDVSRENISTYMIHNLTYSDSGQYQEVCWTEGKVTYEKNVSIIICSLMMGLLDQPVRPGRTLDLPCIGAADNENVLWLKNDFRYGQNMWTRVFGDNTTSVMDNVRGRYQLVENTSALRVFNFTTTAITEFICLVMNQQQCVRNTIRLRLQPETIYHSVEETAVLPCTFTDFSDDQPPQWLSNSPGFTMSSVPQNHSLVLSSLMLNQSGFYSCETSVRKKTYQLLVCPKFGPPAVELFSEGENVTLRCRDVVAGKKPYWFFKSNQTEGRIVYVRDLRMSTVSWYWNGSLVISNISLKDTGEYWCAVLSPYYQCVSTAKTLLKYREPFGIHSTFYKVRCAVLSGLLVVLCVVVVTVNQRTRRGEQL
ncbi:hypothetical protein ABVT39_004136 [Epinephelus coioides]